MDFQWILMIVSLLVIISGLFIIKIERWHLTEPMMALLIGALISSHGFDLVDTQHWRSSEQFLKIASMLTISLSLTVAAYRVRYSFLLAYWKPLMIILLLIMPLMFLASGLIAYGVLALPLTVAFLIGAVITPTDPVVSSTIVSGKFAEKYLPDTLQQILSFESAANDGLAFPLVLMMLFIAGYEEFDGPAEWFVRVVGWETLGAIGIGAGVGYGFGYLMHIAHQRGWMNKKTLLSFSVALSFLVLSLGEVLQANGIIAVFAAGLMVKRAISKHETLQEENVQEMMERLFTIPVFFFLGMFLPIDAWFRIGWPIVIFAALVMLLRRLPAFVITKPLLPQFNRWRDLLFLGWFGPVGVAALFYSMHVLKNTPYQVVWEVTSFVIFFSTLVHGLTSLTLSRWYARHQHQDEKE